MFNHDIFLIDYEKWWIIVIIRFITFCVDFNGKCNNVKCYNLIWLRFALLLNFTLLKSLLTCYFILQVAVAAVDEQLQMISEDLVKTENTLLVNQTSATVKDQLRHIKVTLKWLSKRSWKYLSAYIQLLRMLTLFTFCEIVFEKHICRVSSCM